MNSENLKRNIGMAIRYYRKEKGISQYELAEMADLSVSYISELETGKKLPSFETLLKISKALNIELIDLILPVNMPKNVRNAIKTLMSNSDKQLVNI
jgi:transcriptional regulator with XRE-family HTH domain